MSVTTLDRPQRQLDQHQRDHPMEASFSLKHLKSDLELQMKSSSVLIGRSDNCDFQVDAETLSREHARLVQKGGQLILQDLHSTNGSFVNEQQIFEATAIQPGDVVRFGQESFCLQNTAADATQMFDRQAMSNLSSAMLVADDEEEDGTVMLQAISLPPGWNEGTQAHDAISATPEDEGLVNALKDHARKKLSQPYGMLVTIFEEHKAPSVKLISTEKTQAQWLIGRNAEASLKLDDSRVSDAHAHIVFQNKQWAIKDNDSRNGTFAKGSKISEKAIEGTTEISIEPYTIVLEEIQTS